MSFLAPSALLFAGLAIPLIGLYMLRARRHRRQVSSTMLWQSALESVSAARPWQRLPLTWPLILQLLILAVFVFVLARPFTIEQAELGPHTVFVIDTSGSMALAGRFEAAQAEASTIVQRASESNLVSIVAAGSVPDVKLSFSGDSAEATAALTALEVGGGTEDLAAAIRAARALATPDRPTRLLVFSDGGDPEMVVFDQPIVDARHFLFDQVEDNVAISSFSIDVLPGEGAQVFIEVHNLTLAPKEVEGVIDVDGVAARTFRVRAQPGGRGRDSVIVEADAGSIVEARLIDESGSDLVDGNALDNQAVAIVPTSPELSVGVTGHGSIFLDALLRSTPGVAVGEDPDIIVADGVVPESFERPTWLIRPPVSPESLTLTGVVQNVAVTYQRPGEPILDSVDLSEVVIGEAQIVDGPGWLPIVSAGDVPLILLGEVEGVRVVYSTFDLTHSNLPVQIAFPVMGSRLLRWLAGDDVAPTAVSEAGTPIILTGSSTEAVVVTRPDGSRVDLPTGALIYPDTDAPGLYIVSYTSPVSGERPGSAEMRSFASRESVGMSQELPVVDPSTGSASAGSLVRELAPLLLLLVLLLFMVEWIATHPRRPTAAEPLTPTRRRLTSAGRR